MKLSARHGHPDEPFENDSRTSASARAATLQEEERSLTDAELEMLFPSVPWRDPIRISDFDGDFGFACRFCIARHGIRGCDIPSLSMGAREVRRHIREHHPWSESAMREIKGQRPGRPSKRVLRALDRVMKLPRGKTAGHLSGDRATRCTIEGIPAAERR